MNKTSKKSVISKFRYRYVLIGKMLIALTVSAK
jgi:hypothetical protein